MSSAARDVLNVHASAVVLGERGVLIRGASGAGKTALALALVDRARASGGFARMVADDRALLTRHAAGSGAEASAGSGGRLVARPHPALAGRAERRGLGIVAVEHEPACVVALVVDLVGPTSAASPDFSVLPGAGRLERHPAPDALRCTVHGVELPRLAVAAGPPTLDALALIASAVSGLSPSGLAPTGPRVPGAAP